ncbi:MAG: DUF1573 domain-containing protein [Chloroflexi bacterium]|nr:DUF1573 domain-containing protein [Chloroflexota bacterium]
MALTPPAWRWALLTAVVATALAVLAAACGGAGAPVSGPKLVLDGDSFEMGDIKVDQIMQRSVEFRNGGSEPLEVSIVKVRPAPGAACGCGVEGYQVRPSTVAPGASGELVFTLKVPKGMESMQDKMLAELASNDPSNPTKVITLIFNMSP